MWENKSILLRMVLFVVGFFFFLNFQEKLEDRVTILMKMCLKWEKKNIFHNPLGDKDTRKSLYETLEMKFHLINIFILYVAILNQCA